MKISLAKKNRAFAIIIALVAITVLSILAGAFAYSMKVETRLAANANNDEQLVWLGRAGVEMARYVVTLDNNQPYDALNQIWAGGPGAGSETNSALMGLSLQDYPVGDGKISIKIIDLERKVNINIADTPLLQQALTAMGADANDLSVVSDSIQDWIDRDDATRPAGAESDYYQGLTPAYYAKNAPMDDISELLLVKGVTPEMYFGSNATNSQNAFQHHKLGFGNAPGQAPEYAFGLVDVFTPFSSGKINVNTADANVLQLIPGMDTVSVQNILKFRAGPDGVEGTADDTPFQNLNQIVTAGVDQQAFAQASRYLTTRSNTFEVHVTAQIGESTREFVAVVWRNGNNTQVFSFYWK
jgi:general secretion pathway protein K